MAKIGIDMDGVLVDFFTGFNEIAMKMYPDRGITPDWYPTTYDLTEYFTQGELDKIWYKINHTQNWWLGLGAYHDNVGHLASWVATTKHNDIYFCTARPEGKGMTIAQQVDWWLRACGLYQVMNYFGIIVVDGAEAKAPVYLNVGIRWSIDDKEETVASCNKVPGHRAFLQGRPWNRTSKAGPRVKHIGEFLAEITNVR